MIQASAVCQPFYCVLSVIWQHGSHAVTQFLVFAIVLLWLKWARGLLIFLFSECLSVHLLKNGPTTFQQLSPCQISASVPKAQLCILLRSLCWSSHCGPCIDCIETRSLFKWERPGTRGARGTLHNKTRSFALLNLLNLLATHGDVMHIISLHSYMAKSIKIYQNLPQHAFSESRSAKDHETTCLKSHPATKPSNVHFLNLKGPLHTSHTYITRCCLPQSGSPLPSQGLN